MIIKTLVITLCNWEGGGVDNVIKEILTFRESSRANKMSRLCP